MSKEVRKVHCKDTLAVQTHRILPAYTNSHGDLYGGQLLYFLDNAASISQTRLTKNLSMTASIDNVNFLALCRKGIQSVSSVTSQGLAIRAWKFLQRLSEKIY